MDADVQERVPAIPLAKPGCRLTDEEKAIRREKVYRMVFELKMSQAETAQSLGVGHDIISDEVRKLRGELSIPLETSYRVIKVNEHIRHYDFLIGQFHREIAATRRGTKERNASLLGLAKVLETNERFLQGVGLMDQAAVKVEVTQELSEEARELRDEIFGRKPKVVNIDPANPAAIVPTRRPSVEDIRA